MKADPKSVNDRQRRFCEAVAKGTPAGRAYELAGYSARGTVANAAASRLLGEPAVFRYLAELRATTAGNVNVSRGSEEHVARAAARLTPSQRTLAERVVEGIPARRAYHAAGYCGRGHTADVEAGRILRRPHAAHYVALLRNQAAELESMKRAELYRYLEEVIQTPPGSLTADSPLIVKFEDRTSSKGRRSIHVTMVSKLGAAALLANLRGWCGATTTQPSRGNACPLTDSPRPLAGAEQDGPD